MPKCRLISHDLCPYAQRSRVMLHEKGVDFELEEVDLKNKPDWFVQMAPTSKVPTLEVTDEDGGRVILFESLVINEYLDEVAGDGSALPRDPLQRARIRSWIEYATTLLQDCFALTAAKDEETLAPIIERVRARLDRLERELGDGPFFLGESMSLVDAAYVPVLQRLDFADELYPTMALFGESRRKVTRWWKAIEVRPSIAASAPADVKERFYETIGRDRGGYFSVIGGLANSRGDSGAGSPAS